MRKQSRRIKRELKKVEKKLGLQVPKGSFLSGKNFDVDRHVAERRKSHQGMLKEMDKLIQNSLSNFYKYDQKKEATEDELHKKFMKRRKLGRKDFKVNEFMSYLQNGKKLRELNKREKQTAAKRLLQYIEAIKDKIEEQHYRCEATENYKDLLEGQLYKNKQLTKDLESCHASHEQMYRKMDRTDKEAWSLRSKVMKKRMKNRELKMRVRRAMDKPICPFPIGYLAKCCRVTNFPHACGRCNEKEDIDLMDWQARENNFIRHVLLPSVARNAGRYNVY